MKTSEPKKSTMRRLIIIGASVVFVAMAAIIIYLLTRSGDAAKKVVKDDRPTVVTSQNSDQIKANIDKPVEDGYYEVGMNTTWTFDGKTSDAFVENSKNNNRTVYFDVFRSDTKELVYSSPYIPVGDKIQNFALTADLEPGSYDGLVTYHLVDENNEEVSNLSVAVTLTVK
jgi:uncharacterized Fe-S cluster-containing protein